MPGKIFATNYFLPEVRQVPTLVEIRTEVYGVIIEDGAAAALRRIAYLFFCADLSDRSAQTKRTLLRLVWEHIERRAAQHAEDVCQAALELMQDGIDEEWLGDASAPKRTMATARTDLTEEWKRARLIGRASALIDLICTGDYELSEPTLLGLANRLS